MPARFECGTKSFGIGLDPHLIRLDRFLGTAFDGLVIPRQDVQTLRLADAIFHRKRFGDVLARPDGLADVAVDRAQPRVRERKVGIQLDRLAKER